MFKNETGDFDNDSGTQTLNGFCQQTLDIASGILKAVKSAFNVFTNAVEQSVKFGRILQRLVGTFGGPDAVARVLADVGLPVVTDKAFVTKDVAVPDVLQNDLGGLTLVDIGCYQVIHHWQAIQRGQHNQLVAVIVEITGRTVSIASTASKRTVALATLITHRWNRFGIQQQAFGVNAPKLAQPLPAQHLYKMPQAACPPIILALIHQFRKLTPVIGSYIAQVLCFSWIRNEILGQHQRHHLTILKFWLGTRFALQKRLTLAYIPVIYQHQDGCQKAYHVYTCRHGSVVL